METDRISFRCYGMLFCYKNFDILFIKFRTFSSCQTYFDRFNIKNKKKKNKFQTFNFGNKKRNKTKTNFNPCLIHEFRLMFFFILVYGKRGKLNISQPALPVGKTMCSNKKKELLHTPK